MGAKIGKALGIQEIIGEQSPADKLTQLDNFVKKYPTAMVGDGINDAAALVEQLDLIISPDTSIVHLASAFDKPIVSIHENNKHSFRLWSPSSTLSKTVFAKSNYGLFDYNVDKIIKYSLEFIRKLENK